MAARPRRGSASRPVSSSLPAFDTAEWRLRYLRAVNATGPQDPGASGAAAPGKPQTREPSHDLGDGLRFVGEGGKEDARKDAGAGSSAGEVGIVGSLPQRPAPLVLRQMANRKRGEGGQASSHTSEEAGSPPIHGAAPGSSSGLALPPAAPHRRTQPTGLHRPPASSSPRPIGSRPVAVPVRGASYQLAVPDVELSAAASPSGPSSMSSSSSGLGAIFRSPSGTAAATGRRTSATSATSAVTPGLIGLQPHSGGSEASSDSHAVTVAPAFAQSDSPLPAGRRPRCRTSPMPTHLPGPASPAHSSASRAAPPSPTDDEDQRSPAPSPPPSSQAGHASHTRAPTAPMPRASALGHMRHARAESGRSRRISGTSSSASRGHTAGAPFMDLDAASASPSAASTEPSTATAAAATPSHASRPRKVPSQRRHPLGASPATHAPATSAAQPAPVAASMPSEDSPCHGPLSDAAGAPTSAPHRRASAGSLDSAVAADVAPSGGAYAAFATSRSPHRQPHPPSELVSGMGHNDFTAGHGAGPGSWESSRGGTLAPLAATGPMADPGRAPDARSPRRSAVGDRARLRAIPSLGLLHSATDAGHPLAAPQAFLDGVGAGGHADEEEDEEEEDDMFFAFGEDDGMPGGGHGGWVDGLATPRQLSASSPRGFIPPHELAARGRTREEFVPGSQPM
ncbi:hypothetical protein FNF31_07397 [Cafeteria roenbergensis]|uniref:Uncharacterized protein n=1 Tax=Cafeteria roenbergensis TaxID=33653 RepID=A0A5A8C6Q0_CAFRO|nr:hypothetical protein FNF31_07397 [Cafeteria roenbergensis]